MLGPVSVPRASLRNARDFADIAAGRPVGQADHRRRTVRDDGITRRPRLKAKWRGTIRAIFLPVGLTGEADESVDQGSLTASMSALAPNPSVFT